MLHIAEARNMAGWSQEQLAQAIGSTQQTVQRWETGQTDPQVGKIQAISAALGVTVSYLLGVEESQSAYGPTTDAEQELVRLYRSCSPKGREYLLQVAQVTAGIFQA